MAIKSRTDHPEPLIVIHGHFHGNRPVIRYKTIYLAKKSGVAVMSVEDVT